jgi:hypothetical protein
MIWKFSIKLCWQSRDSVYYNSLILWWPELCRKNILLGGFFERSIGKAAVLCVAKYSSSQGRIGAGTCVEGGRWSTYSHMGG